MATATVPPEACVTVTVTVTVGAYFTATSKSEMPQGISVKPTFSLKKSRRTAVWLQS
jgi:hypothetical protein